MNNNHLSPSQYVTSFEAMSISPDDQLTGSGERVQFSTQLERIIFEDTPAGADRPMAPHLAVYDRTRRWFRLEWLTSKLGCSYREAAEIKRGFEVLQPTESVVEWFIGGAVRRGVGRAIHWLNELVFELECEDTLSSVEQNPETVKPDVAPDVYEYHALHSGEETTWEDRQPKHFQILMGIVRACNSILDLKDLGRQAFQATVERMTDAARKAGLRVREVALAIDILTGKVSGAITVQTETDEIVTETIRAGRGRFGGDDVLVTGHTTNPTVIENWTLKRRYKLNDEGVRRARRWANAQLPIMTRTQSSVFWGAYNARKHYLESCQVPPLDDSVLGRAIAKLATAKSLKHLKYMGAKAYAWQKERPGAMTEYGWKRFWAEYKAHQGRFQAAS